MASGAEEKAFQESLLQVDQAIDDQINALNLNAPLVQKLIVRRGVMCLSLVRTCLTLQEASNSLKIPHRSIAQAQVSNPNVNI